MILKRGGGAKAGSRGGCLKKGGTGTPIQTMIMHTMKYVLDGYICC